MAIINRCVICEERLVRNRCPLCGLDHTNRMKINYRLNTSRPYQMPAEGTSAQTRSKTQIPNRKGNHTVPNKSRGRQTIPNKSKTPQTVPNRRQTDKPLTSSSVSRTEYSARTSKTIRQPQVKTKKEEKGQTFSRIIPLIVVFVVMIVSTLVDEYGGSYEREPEYEVEQNTVHQNSVNQEFYENVSYDLSETGESFEFVLSQGEYLVGTHLPEGHYHVDLVKGSSGFSITNPSQGIYDWYYFSPENGETVQLDDLPLYQDTQLIVSGGAYLALATDCGQIDAMYETTVNSLPPEEITLEEGIFYRVGTDLAAGVYDLHQTEGDCYFMLGSSEDTDGKSIDVVHREMWLGINSDEKAYRNLILENGMVVYLEPTWEGSTVLTPSEVVKADGYDAYYELYW